MALRLDIIRDLIKNTLNDTNYEVSSYYKEIKYGEDIDRFVEHVNEMIENTNEVDKTAFCTIIQSNNGSISYVDGVTPIYDFDFTLNVQCVKSIKDTVITKLDNLMSTLSSRTNNYSGYTINIGFSNPIIDLPSILNGDELVSIDIEASCSMIYGKFLTEKDLVRQVKISIPSLNIEEQPVKVLINSSQYDTRENNRQTKTTNYYTEIYSYQCGIKNAIKIVCDLENPVCSQLFKMSLIRVDNPADIELNIETTIGSYLKSKCKYFITNINPETTDGGIIALSIELSQQSNISYEILE